MHEGAVPAVAWRSIQRHALMALLDTARSGRGTAAILLGEPGTGKTRLLDDLAGAAADTTVLRWRGVEAEAGLPYAALTGLLAGRRASVERLPPAQRSALSAALGEGPPSPGDPLRVAAATLAVITAEAESCPVLVVVDDAQWLDAPTRNALLFAARRIEVDRVAVVLAARTAEAAELIEAGVERIDLPPLADDEARQLARAAAGSAIARHVEEQVVGACAGNPLALRETVRALSPEQLAGHVPLPELPVIGPSLARAYAPVVERLPPPARQALALVAVAGSQDAPTLRRALEKLGLSAAALAEAERSGLVAVGADRLRLAGPLARAAALDSVGPADLRTYHRALAEVLDPETEPERHALHLAAAAEDDAQPETLAALRRAASSAVARGAPAAAAEALEAASRIAPAEARASLALQAAVHHLGAGQAERSAALAEQVERQAGDPLVRADARRVRGGATLRAGALTQGYDLLVAGANAIRDADPVRAAHMLVEAALAHTITADQRALERAAREALELAEQAGEPQVQVVATLLLGEALACIGNPGEAARLLRAGEPVLASALAAPVPELVGLAANAWAWLEDLDRAEAIISGYVQECRTAGAAGAAVYPLSVRSQIALRRGRWAPARADVEEAIALAQAAGAGLHLLSALAAAVRLDALQGRESEARGRAQALLGEAGSGIGAFRLYALAGLAVLELGLGNWEAAEATYDAVARETAALGVGEPNVLQWQPDQVEACLRTGHTEKAAAAARDLEAAAHAAPSAWAAAAVVRCRGLLAGDDGFEAPLREAAERHRAAGQSFDEARTRLLLGERLRRRRVRQAAREQLESAVREFQRVGAAPWAARAAHELELLGVIAEGGPARRPADLLTAQELRVAQLVAGGATNRETAAALFISPKTVEYHLGRAYRKLGVASRAALATALTD